MSYRFRFWALMAAMAVSAGGGCAGPGGANDRASGCGNHCAVDVRAFGAAGDGVTKDTAALQRAVDAVAAVGGGTVSVPAGRYLTGSVVLRSGVTLALRARAVLLGSTDPGDYLRLPHDQPGRVQAPDASGAAPPPRPTGGDPDFLGLILASGQHDVALRGPGTINGRGTVLAAHVHALIAAGRLGGNPQIRPDESQRPLLIDMVGCRAVTVADVNLRDSACWVQNYTACDGLTIRGVTVRSQAFWNNDGLDLTGCRHVRVADCDIDSADDGICLKSAATACEDVAISRCRVRSFANGIKFGTASFTGFHHVSIDHVAVVAAGHAGPSLESVDGGIMDDVSVSDVTMRNVRAGLFVQIGSRHLRDGRVGDIGHVTLTRVAVELSDGSPDRGQPFPAPVPSYPHNRFPCEVCGLPGHPVHDVVLRQVTFVTPGGGGRPVGSVPLDALASIPEDGQGYPEYGMHGELPACGWFVRHATGVTLDDAIVRCGTADDRAAIVCADVADLSISHLRVTNPGQPPAVVVLAGVHYASVHDGSANTGAATFVRTQGACDRITTSANVLRP